jgi:hypothetical protein
LADVPRALQNEYADRSLRRECVDQVVIFDERHLRGVLLSDMKYDDEARTFIVEPGRAGTARRLAHRAHRCGPLKGGLHHQYVRI